MKEWEDFLSGRKQYLASIRGMRKLPPEIQAAALREALIKSQLLDVLEYLQTIEDPANATKFPLASLMQKTLIDIAAVPGETAPIARAFIEAMAKDPQALPTLLTLVDKKIDECLLNPQDDEVWIYTAELIRAIDEKKFNDFLEVCKSHPSKSIRDVASFFLE